MNFYEMGKQASLLYKKLDNPVPVSYTHMTDRGKKPARTQTYYADAERTVSPRALTRLFTNPESDMRKAYHAMLASDPSLLMDNSVPLGATVFGEVLKQLYPWKYSPASGNADPDGPEDQLMLMQSGLASPKNLTNGILLASATREGIALPGNKRKKN